MDKQNKILINTRRLLVLLLLTYFFWWLVNQLVHSDLSYVGWGVTYWIFTLIGGVVGLASARHWGGMRSIMGKITYAFSIGLLLQGVGQNFANYYILNDIEIYPSLADIGFFGGIPFYIYGSIMLTKLSGVKVALRKFSSKLIGVTVFCSMLVVSYYFLLSEVNYDSAHPLLFILDFGYPFGQAFFVSFAILAVILTRKILGGLMRSTLLVLLIALIMQFIADYSFSILLGNDVWEAGGFNDLAYMMAYFLMAYGLVNLNLSYHRVLNTK